MAYADAYRWPSVERGQIAYAPVRVGVDRRTREVLIGWPHVAQSIEILFETRFHESILREWFGSFVPHMLGQSAVESAILRFYWAIATAIDLWEPGYSVRRVMIQTDDTDPANPVQLTSADELRQGHVTFRIEGVYYPRGHLGDFTPEGERSISLVGEGGGRWRRQLS